MEINNEESIKLHYSDFEKRILQLTKILDNISKEDFDTLYNK